MWSCNPGLYLLKVTIKEFSFGDLLLQVVCNTGLTVSCLYVIIICVIHMIWYGNKYVIVVGLFCSYNKTTYILHIICCYLRNSVCLEVKVAFGVKLSNLSMHFME